MMKYCNKIFLSAFFIFLFLISKSVYSIELPHEFKTLNETDTVILLEYNTQKIPSPEDIQKEIEEINQVQGSGVITQRSEFGDQGSEIVKYNPIVHRTLVAIPKNVEPSLEIIQDQREQLPKETSELLLKMQEMGSGVRGQGSEGLKQNSGLSTHHSSLINLTTGYLRNQRVAIVEVSPIKQDTTNNNFSIAKKIVFKVKLQASSQEPICISQNYSARSTQNSVLKNSDPLFESIYKKSILNYKGPGQWAIGNGQDKNADVPTPQNPTNSLSTQYSELSTELSPIKITVKEKGIYSVTYDDIKAAGWDPKQIDPFKLQLKDLGESIPILFIGNDDHSFDTPDYFIFYGQPVESTMTHILVPNNLFAFSVPNVYWLSIANKEQTQMQVVQKSAINNVSYLTDFINTEHFETDKGIQNEHVLRYYWAKFPDDNDTERTDPSTKEFKIKLTGINNLKSAILRTKFFGGYNNPDINPDHHIVITVNNKFSYDTYFDGTSLFKDEEYISSNIFEEGENTIKIQTVFQSESDTDLLFLDWIEVEYNRLFKANDNELFFADNTTSTHNINIDNFQNSQIMLFDITDPLNVKKVEGTISDASGNYSLSFNEQENVLKSYVALTSEKIKKPVSVLLDEPSNLKNKTNRADYIIITHEDFYDGIQPLVEHRQEDGFTVQVIKIQDIYDEFNSGIIHPQAIKDFLTYAFSYWTSPAPTYVLLVGDGCTDATDRLNRGNKNFIPVKFDFFYDRYTGNDTWYVQISGKDVLPDMIIGRLPVQTNDQLKIIIDKIINYENSAEKEWMRNIQFIAGKKDAEKFLKYNKEIADSVVPFNYSVSHLSFSTANSDTPPSDSIINKINNGQAITCYFGHSALNNWSELIDTSNLNGLTNIDKPTFLLSLDCSNGNFSHPFAQGFSEEFLKSNGGGLATFSASALVYISEDKVMGYTILYSLFNNNNHLGAVCTQAKIDTYLSGSLSSSGMGEYTFLGDPATKFKLLDFNISNPTDNATIEQQSQFTWIADGYNRFKIQFSPNIDFTFPTRLFITRNVFFKLNPLLWGLFNIWSQQYGTIYWRVGGLKNITEYSTINEFFYDLQDPRYTQPLSFTIK